MLRCEVGEGGCGASETGLGRPELAGGYFAPIDECAADGNCFVARLGI